MTKRVGCSKVVLWCGALCLIAFPELHAQTSVLTYRNDNGRTAQNLTETRLTPANVNSTTFGKLFNYPVDGRVDAQPLVVSALAIPNHGTPNVAFAATEHDSLYAFDATTGATYWQITLLKPGETSSDTRSCGQVSPEIGVTATPAIDLNAGPHGTIYVVAMSKDSGGGYHQRLHAVDITTGAEQFGGPVDIQATYPGTGDNSSGGNVVFDPKQYKERTALLIMGGVVYTSWASHCDIRPYTGWTMSYDELTLAQKSVLNFTPNGNEGAIWGAGGGLSADSAGNVYYQIGNGTFDTTLNGSGFPSNGDFGNAFVKVAPVVTNGVTVLTPLDYWTMDNTTSESASDEDLGSGGVLILPDLTDSLGHTRHLGTGAGKDRNVYLFDRDNMGKFDSADNSNLYQELALGLSGGEFSCPAWFNGNLYYGGSGDVIRSFRMTSARLASTPSSTTTASYTFPGTSPSISANGTSNAILWAIQNNSPAVLHAYDANDLLTEFYNSNQASGGRDQFGSGNKYMTPTIANGEVFVGTPNSVAVFGLMSALPTVFIEAPATNATLTDRAVLGGWAIENAATAGPAAVSSVTISVDGNQIGTATYGVSRPDVCAVFPGRLGCPAVGWTYNLNVAALTSGSHTLKVTATDTLGYSSSTTTSFTAGHSLPAIDIENPIAGATLSGTTAIGGWAIEDTSVPGPAAVSSVTVFVDGTQVGTASYGVSRPDVCTVFPGRLGCPNVGWSYNLNVNALSSGSHTLKIVATDTGNNSSYSQVGFNVVPPPPSVDIEAPTQNATVSGTVAIGGWAIENTAIVGPAAISSVAVLVDGTQVGTAAYGVSRPDVCAVFPGRLGCPNVGWSYNLNVTPLTSGSHTLKIVATDSANKSSFTQVGFISAPPIPSINIESPVPNATLGGTVTIGGWAIENTALVGPAAISSVAVLVDGVQVGTAAYGVSRPDVCAVFPGRLGCPNVGWSYSLNVASLVSGSHTLTIKATDTANNSSSSQIAFVK